LKEKDIDKKDKIKHKSVYVLPQIGVFTRPNKQISYVLNSDVGYKIQHIEKHFYIASSLGVDIFLRIKYSVLD